MKLKVTLCPTCGTRIAPPHYLILLLPMWPFHRWNCQACGAALRFRLLSFTAWGVGAFVSLFVVLAVLKAAGVDHTTVILGSIPLALGALCVPARFAKVQLAP